MFNSDQLLAQSQNAGVAKPPKVVYRLRSGDGQIVNGGDRTAQGLASSYLGQIRAFVAAARQQANLSGRTSVNLMREMPGDGWRSSGVFVRYIRNFGSETIRIDVGGYPTDDAEPTRQIVYADYMIIGAGVRDGATLDGFFNAHIRSLNVPGAPVDTKFGRNPSVQWFGAGLTEWRGRKLIEIGGFGVIGIGELAIVVYLRNLRELFGEGIFPIRVQTDWGTTLTGTSIPGTYSRISDIDCTTFSGGEIGAEFGRGVFCTGRRMQTKSHNLRIETSAMGQLHNAYGGCYEYDGANVLSFTTATTPVPFWGMPGDGFLQLPTQFNVS